MFKLRNTTLTSLATAMVVVMNLGAAPSHAAEYKKIKIGSWKGGIYTNNKTGRFSHCAVSARYKSGITLLFSVTRGLKWKMGFSKPSWELEVNKGYNILYQVDKNQTKKGRAFASSKKLAVVSLPGSNKLFAQMRRGRTLRVKAGDDILSFNLTGTSKMLRALLRCAERNENLVVSPRSANNSKNPFAGKKAANNNTQPAPKRSSKTISPEFRAEARDWYDLNLGALSAEYSVVPNQGSAAKMYKSNAIIWRIGKKTGIFGTLRIFPRKKPATLENNVLAFEARNCKGDFASKFFKNDGISSQPASRLMATCRKTDGKTFSAYYAISDRNEGGSYLVTLLSSRAAPQNVIDAGERITGILQTGNTPQPVAQPEEDDDFPARDDEKEVKRF